MIVGDIANLTICHTEADLAQEGVTDADFHVLFLFFHFKTHSKSHGGQKTQIKMNMNEPNTKGKVREN